jgi:DNA adenine methylase
MNYMSAKEAAQLWGISQRRVAILCSEQRIPNVE